MIDLARLGPLESEAFARLTERAVDPRKSRFAGGRFKAGVGDSEDLERIVALPRRTPPTEAEQRQMAAVMTALLRKERTTPCECATLSPGDKDPCLTELWPVQGWYLWEAMTTGGAAGMLSAGAGKTAIDVLLALVVPDVKRAALLIPPNLRAQFAHDYRRWSQHFRTPNVVDSGEPFTPGAPKLDVLAYSELSNESCATWLKIHRPDLVICDESQALKDKTSARTFRFLDFFVSFDGTTLAFHSGSVTTRSPDDCAHLFALALKYGSPYPIDPATVGEWSAALGAKASIGAGKLGRLCAPGETPRAGFRRRLVETAGVISTDDAQLDLPLIIRERVVELPDIVQRALRLVRDGERPDTLTGAPIGEELVERMEQAECARQVALGFFYRWIFPKGEPEALIDEWFAKRKAWNRELRLKLEHRTDLMDSPGLLQAAAERAALGYTGILPTWPTLSWAPWRDIETAVYHETEDVWLTDVIALDAVAWGRAAPGVIWYEHVEFGRRVAELGGFPIFEGGDEASATIALEDGKRTIVASVEAHGTGKNLQMFNRGLVTCPSASGGRWEQLLARFHRPKQNAPEVVFDVYLMAAEMRDAFASALADARYVHENTGKIERLRYATFGPGMPNG